MGNARKASRGLEDLADIIRRVEGALSEGPGGAGGGQATRGGPAKRSILDYLYGDQGEAGPGMDRERRAQSSQVGEPPSRGGELQELWDNYVEEAEGYLLEVRYDGVAGRAIAVMYDPARRRLVRWVDRTDHKPYFLVDKKPEELGELGLDPESEPLVVQCSPVTKYHPILRRRVRLTKIVVSDPLAVRSLRGRAQARGARYWEADIRYHHNYIYDNQLVPGMKYRASRGWARVGWGVNGGYVREVAEAFSREPEEALKTALEWAPIFEQPPPDPPRVAFDIEVYTPREGRIPDPDNPEYPVISIALASTDGLRRVMLLATPRSRFESGLGEELSGVEVEIFDEELPMLLELLRAISSYPVVLTFNGDNFDIPYIAGRLRSLGISGDSLPIEFHGEAATFSFAVHIDLRKLFDIRALQVYAFGNRYREKSLGAVAEALLGTPKIEVGDAVSRLPLESLARYNYRDAELTLRLTTFGGSLVWNLIVLLMRISRLGVEDVTRSQVSSWVRSLMNWEHRRRGWLIPSREEIEELGGAVRSRAVIKEKKYKGAIVLEPPRGVFFNVAVMDFASLYPSIIKNWNLSYETVNNPNCGGETRLIPEVGHEVCMEFRGITSELVGLLKDFRVRVYKRRARDEKFGPRERTWYDTVQAAMKVYVNASYGVFGNESFPYYSLALAESVTAIGRSVLVDTLRYASLRELHIIYGDTDSLFLWDPDGEGLESLARYVEESHSLDLELDTRFRLAFFSGLKKNYLGITESGELVIKGMVAKKSNTPEFIKREFASAMKTLTSIEGPEDVVGVLERLRSQVAEIHKKLKNREYTLDELAIRVMLSKDPRQYHKNTPQHVKAALLLSKEGVDVGKGDIIGYVKTRDRVGVKPVKLAKLSEVDTGKYMEYVKTAFEQVLLAFGIRWEEMSGVKTLTNILNL